MRQDERIDGEYDSGGPRERQREMPTLAESLGGPWGMAESTVPAVVFIVAYTASGSDLKPSAVIALAVAVVLTVIRLLRRESPQQALSGLVGVAIAAYFANRTGKAEDFFLPGLLINAAYGLGLLISGIVGWPIVGVVTGLLDGKGTAWKRDPARLRVMRRATWLWVGMFALRIAVKLPLYLAGKVVWLGIASTVMGFPLFALVLYITYRWVSEVEQVTDGGPDAAPAAGR